MKQETDNKSGAEKQTILKLFEESKCVKTLKNSKHLRIVHILQ